MGWCCNGYYSIVIVITFVSRRISLERLGQKECSQRQSNTTALTLDTLIDFAFGPSLSSNRHTALLPTSNPCSKLCYENTGKPG